MFYNIFFCKIFGQFAKKQYFCTVFFMVLDLRLSKKIGMSGDILLCFYRNSPFF